MTKPLSNPLIGRTVGTDGAAGRWAEGDVAAGADLGMPGAEMAGLGAAGAAAEAVGGAMLGTPVGPAGGSVGNLMVGAAEGFGGKLMRTVSFLGCTLPVDFFIGSAP